MRNDDIKVSVVIPVYNSEAYLTECLESVMNQTLSEIEIICVDDGSTDNSVDIIKRYMHKDSRIKLIQQKNMYAGIARNKGMELAQGKYIIFWDSDDFFDSHALKLMSDQMEEDQADICVCDALQYDTLKKKKVRGPKYLNLKYLPEVRPFSYKDIPDKIFNFTTDVPWNKMYRREFVEKNELEFQGIVRANDHYFVLSAAIMARSITYVDKPLIFYRINHTTSLTATLSASPLCTYEAFCAAKGNLLKTGLWENEAVRKSFANRCLNSLIYLMDKQNTFEAFQIIFQKLVTEGFENLGVLDKGKEYYDSTESYKILRQMLENSADDFLILHFKDYYEKNKILDERLKNIQNNKCYKIIQKVRNNNFYKMFRKKA